MVLWQRVAAVAAAAVAVACVPLVHRIPRLPRSIDLGVASALDAVEAQCSWPWPFDQLDWPTATGWWVFNPGRFHGPGTLTTSGSARAGFFEGYYYKMVTNSNRTIVVIPGAIYHAGGGGFAFVMLGDPAAHTSTERVQLYKFPLTDLKTIAVGDFWELQIGANRFGPRGLALDIERALAGKVAFEETVIWPATLIFPDVMGWFAWLPGMEFRHGVVTLGGKTRGKLRIRDDPVDLGGGSVYVEKDWGSSFPKTWVWLQCSHFTCPRGRCSGATLMLSLASTPFPSDRFELLRFRGFLSGLWTGRKLYRFATYTGATITAVSLNAAEFNVTIQSQQRVLTVSAVADPSMALYMYTPTPGGAFKPVTHEMLGAVISVKLVQRADQTVLFEGTGHHGGLEIESLEPGGLRLLTR